MQLMQFYHALKNAAPATVNGQKITDFHWEDDGEDGLALRVKNSTLSVLILSTDKIVRTKNCVTVSIGASDYEFEI